MQLKRIGSAFDRIHRIEQNSNLEKIEQSSNSLQSQINNLVDGKFDEGALNTHIEEKLNDLETQYAPKLTEVSTLLEDTTNKLITNKTLFVDSSISFSGNGTEQTPFKTINEAISSIGVFAENAKILIKSGTYREQVIIDSKLSENGNWLVLEGEKDSNGTPTTVIDGIGMELLNGINIRDSKKIKLENLSVTNFRNFGENTTVSGIVSERSFVWYKNVHVSNCDFAGINNNIQNRVLLEGVVIDNCTNYGIRNYAQTSFSIGYNGSADNRVSISNCNTGIINITSSSGHCDFIDIVDCDYGIMNQWNAHCAIWSCNFINVTNPVDARLSSSWSHSPEYPNSYGNGSNKYYWSANTEQLRKFQVNSNGNMIIGADTDAIAQAPLHIRRGQSTINASIHNSATEIIESDSNTILGILPGNDSSYSALWFGDSTHARRGEIRHNAGVFSINYSGNTGYRIREQDFIRQLDNASALGTASFRWTQLFAATSTINTSDRNEKQQITSIPDNVLDAWAEVDFKRFKFNDSVEEKGEKARYHFGVIAQEIEEAFSRHGLDAFEYGLLCFDEWDDVYELDDDGNEVLIMKSGSRYSIRADECQFLEMALMRREMERIKSFIRL